MWNSGKPSLGEYGLSTGPIERVVRGAEAAAYAHTLDGWLEASRGV